MNGGVGPAIASPDVPAESKMDVPDTRRTPVAVDPPVFVTVTVTKAVSPTHMRVADSAIDPTRLAGDNMLVQTVSDAARGTVPHVVPEAVIVKQTGPAPVAEYVQVKVIELPDISVDDPAGTGPNRRTTNGAPGPTKIVAERPVTSVPPVLVTVRVTVNHCPTTGVTGPEADAESMPGTVT